MVDNVLGCADEGPAARRLSELSRAQPGDATLRNLLGILSARLDLCSKLPVFEWEAAEEGFPECARMFRSLADAERRSCQEIIDALGAHLHRHAGPTSEQAA